ncbi:helix-turn-helix domain-containing protein [Caballeronia sp. LZ001]|uniref:helix-turn-helix domain-containing protein n=1 Tax=Caballeronia sp. LZ001 TaxID=3038553 RepID=UPI00285477C4|nr:helix-turn-helix domain-containing protein [Caballeronia sp. LZ001]MDR5801607.1 helix-turn-helix domain-containing protein [Caballeronia sp. LZ001]
MTTKKNAALAQNRKAAESIRTKVNTTGNSAAAQRARLMAALRKGPVSTIAARKAPIDAMMPAARIHELRHQGGFNIVLTWVFEPTDGGRLHRVGRYTLQPGKWRQS